MPQNPLPEVWQPGPGNPHVGKIQISGLTPLGPTMVVFADSPGAFALSPPFTGTGLWDLTQGYAFGLLLPNSYFIANAKGNGTLAVNLNLRHIPPQFAAGKRFVVQAFDLTVSTASNALLMTFHQ
jgi:hypothetical protein